MSNFIRVFESIQKTGGASFCLHTGELNPPTGYMVSEEGNEMKFAIPKTLNKFQDIVIQYMLKKSKAFVFESPDEYLGFWIDNNQLYIDISRRFENKQSAIGYGRINNQIAIFDNANKQSIFLSKDRDMQLLARFSNGLLISMIGYVAIVAGFLLWYFVIRK